MNDANLHTSVERTIPRTRTMALIAIMAAITCVLGPLSIPIGPVPISFTNLAIYITVIILGTKNGTISYLIYLLIGLVGLPVFSNFTGGPGKLFGPTGGYLIGFIAMAVITGIFVEKSKGHYVFSIIGMVLGTLVTYLLGTLWLGYQLNLSFPQALSAGVIPFIPGDLIKILIATFVGNAIKKALTIGGLI